MKLRLLILAATLSAPFASAEESQWRSLLDDSLSHWDIFMGVPHKTLDIPGFPKPESPDGRTGTPIGLGKDPLKVFTTEKHGDETVLHISGQIYAGLSTKEEFENYHLSLQFKWGEKKWEPRLKDRRDSGLLVHATGEHGKFWNVWMASLECQIQEHDTGDFITIVNTSAQVRLKPGGKSATYDPSSPWTLGKGYINASTDADKPNGEWNTLEVFTLGDQAVFVVNGIPNMALRDTRIAGKPLTKGKLQLQSEAAEIFYKNIRIRPISAFPSALAPLVAP